MLSPLSDECIVAVFVISPCGLAYPHGFVRRKKELIIFGWHSAKVSYNRRVQHPYDASVHPAADLPMSNTVGNVNLFIR